MIRWWNHDGTMALRWNNDGTMAKQRWYDGERHEGTRVRWWKRHVISRYHHRTFVDSPSRHRTIVVSLSCHRCFTVVSSCHRDSTIVLSCDDTLHSANTLKVTLKTNGFKLRFIVIERTNHRLRSPITRGTGPKSVFGPLHYNGACIWAGSTSPSNVPITFSRYVE
jgi:hypothetical protein